MCSPLDPPTMLLIFVISSSAKLRGYSYAGDGTDSGSGGHEVWRFGVASMETEFLCCFFVKVLSLIMLQHESIQVRLK